MKKLVVDPDMAYARSLPSATGSKNPKRSETALFPGGSAKYFYFVFPNLMFNLHPSGCSVNDIEPKSPELSLVRNPALVVDRPKPGSGAGSDLETVELEGQKVIESVQKGMRSRFYDRDWYSATRETGTHHFQRPLGEFIKDGVSI